MGSLPVAILYSFFVEHYVSLDDRRGEGIATIRREVQEYRAIARSVSRTAISTPAMIRDSSIEAMPARWRSVLEASLGHLFGHAGQVQEAARHRGRLDRLEAAIQAGVAQVRAGTRRQLRRDAGGQHGALDRRAAARSRNAPPGPPGLSSAS
jgi:hypothetical protein